MTAVMTRDVGAPRTPAEGLMATLPRHALRAHLKDCDDGGVRDAVLALAERRADLLSELVDALDDGDAAVRIAAAEALETVARGLHRALEPLAGRLRGAFMTHADPAVQAALASVVTHRRWSDPEIPAISERLMTLRRSRRIATRNAALEALSRLARRSETVARAYALEWETAARGGPTERAKAEALAQTAALPFVGRRAGDHVVQIAVRGQSGGQAEMTTNA